jgi:predicted O-methyltransferase YrrM
MTPHRIGRKTVDEALRASAAVEGWLTEGQGRRLFAAAARVRPGGQIVELGSYRGRSTIVLASAAPPDVELVAVDPHAGTDRGPQEIAGYEAEAAADHTAFMENLRAAGVADRVRHVRAFSHDAHPAVDGAIDLLYVDAAHRLGPALEDITEWGNRVADGGTMMIHDAFSSIGVTLAVMRRLLFGRRFRYVARSRTLVEYRADLAATGLPGRIANVARQLAVLPYFVWNVGLKVVLVVVMARSRKRATLWPH